MTTKYAVAAILKNDQNLFAYTKGTPIVEWEFPNTFLGECESPEETLYRFFDQNHQSFVDITGYLTDITLDDTITRVFEIRADQLLNYGQGEFYPIDKLKTTATTPLSLMILEKILEDQSCVR